MDYKRVFWYLFLSLFVIFIIIYFSSTNGYYEIENNSKKVFTEEKIKQFEEDVKLGKKIDVNNYLNNEEKNYSNKITLLGDKTSYLITNSFTILIEKSLNFINKMLN